MNGYQLVRIAFVVPWFGENLPGGAEAVVRELVFRLKRRGLLVEVLTTCIRDFHADWSRNAWPPGVSEIRGVPVRRFPVEPRRRRRFDRINKRLMFGGLPAAGRSPLSPDDEQTYIREQMRADALIDYLRRHRDAYDLFVFMPYMFATSALGCEAVGRHAVLIPALHDESYAYMRAYRPMFAAAAAVITQTPAEHDLVRRLYGDTVAQKTHLLGMGVDTDGSGSAERFREQHAVGRPMYLYAGRRDVTKGVYRLLDHFLALVDAGGPGDLVLIGPGDLPFGVGDHPRIHDLGFVDIQTKRDAHAAADVFILPSQREAFSIVLLDSWLAGVPALVDARGHVPREHCLRSSAGLYYHDAATFAAALRWFASHPDEARRMGQAGRRYVIENYDWPVVLDRFTRLFVRLVDQRTEAGSAARHSCSIPSLPTAI